MGRPLNKKYFGNRNIGSTSTSADNGIGGEGVASITVGTAGTYTSGTTITFANTPKIKGGVRATGTLTYKVVSATISGGTGYGNAQTFNLTVTTAAGSAVLNVTSTAGGAITTVNSITTAGVFTGISAVTGISGGTGSGATPVLTYGILGVTMTEQGSGYTAAPSVTIGAGTGAASAVLTVDTGPAGSSTNEENAILAQAYVNGALETSLDIVKQINDRVYKVNTSRGTFKFKLKSTAASAAPATLETNNMTYGEMNIVATDQSGATYYVTKLTANKAVLVNFAGTPQFADGKSVKWTFGAAVAPTTGETGVVTITNA